MRKTLSGAIREALSRSDACRSGRYDGDARRLAREFGQEARLIRRMMANMALVTPHGATDLAAASHRDALPRPQQD